jgi:hypothetical protein
MSGCVLTLAWFFGGQALWPICGFCRSKEFSLRWRMPVRNLLFLQKNNQAATRSRFDSARFQTEIFKCLHRFHLRNN